jgi:hypothetical protein
MNCSICKAPIKGFSDSRLVGPQKDIACKDVFACAQRMQANERAARGMNPLPDPLELPDTRELKP